MISSLNLDAFIISLMVSVAFISIFILTIVWFELSKGTKRFKKNNIALLINGNEIIEMKIPINEQKQTSIDQYLIPIKTETLHSCVDANQDYYQSILSMRDIPYFAVRETIFEKYLRFKSEMIIDLKQGNYSNKNDISHV